MKTKVCFIVAGEIGWRQKRSLRTLNDIRLLG